MNFYMAALLCFVAAVIFVSLLAVVMGRMNGD